MVVLVEDEHSDVDIGVEGGGAQVKRSHSHVVHLVVGWHKQTKIQRIQGAPSLVPFLG